MEYASTFLMSCWATAASAANSAVAAPTMAMTSSAVLVSTGFSRTSRYTPAVTMVAAWTMAETGVGPSMASGSQTYSGSWADLPAAASSSSSETAVAVPPASAGATAPMPM